MADTPVEVDVNTENLDDFTALFEGKAKQAGAEPKVEEEVEVDHSVEDDEPVDDDADAADADAEDEPSDAEDESGEDTDGEDEGEKDEDEDDDILAKKPKPKQTAKERIAELTAARRSAERALEDERRGREDLERRLRELEEGRQPKNEPKPDRNTIVTKQDDAAGKPRPDDAYEDGTPVYPLGEYDEQYLSDLTDFRFDQRMKEVDERRAAEAAQSERQAADQQLASKWEGKLSEVEKELPDLRQTIAPLQTEFASLDPNYGMYLAQTIMTMDAGPEVLYYLANNVDEAREIVAAGPQGATLKLGKLEARIQGALAKKAAKPVRQTKAPKPAPVTTRGVGTRGSVRADTDNLDAFEKEFFKR